MNTRIQITCPNYPNTALADLPMNYIDQLKLQMFIDDVEVSRLVVARNTRTQPWYVGNIQTHPAHVRRGYATALYRQAVSILGPIEHSLSRSVYGDAWARSMGHDVPSTPTEQLGIDNFELWIKVFIPNAPAQTAETIADYFGTSERYRCTRADLSMLVG